MKHLWEADHPYYASEGNYYEGHTEYASWLEFVDDEGDVDLDYNLLYRWDWAKDDIDDDGNTIPKSAKGTLKLYFMLQRKALARSVYVAMTDEDEAAVCEWLKPRLVHMLSLWEPLTPPTVVVGGTLGFD